MLDWAILPRLFLKLDFDMNTKMSKLALAIGALVMVGSSWAADNATASATAAVLTPIAIAKNVDMVFGNIVPGNGDVTLSTSAARTKTGTTGFSTSGTAPAAAQFTVTGTDANTFAISYTGSTSVLTNTTGAGAETMAIDWITEVAATASNKTDSTTDAATGTLSSGSATIWAGAKLTAGATQVAGAYTGSLVVTVAYN